MDFARLSVDDWNALASIVDKKLLPRAMALAHDHVEFVGPSPIGLEEPTVLEALWCGSLITDGVSRLQTNK
jgi:hypothetical protein